MAVKTICSYGIVTRILSETKKRVPNSFAPTRLLDIGCAAAALLCMSVSCLLGSASCEQFPSIQSVSLVDGSEYMTSIATDLLHSKNRDFTITSFSSLLVDRESGSSDWFLSRSVKSPSTWFSSIDF